MNKLLTPKNGHQTTLVGLNSATLTWHINCQTGTCSFNYSEELQRLKSLGGISTYAELLSRCDELGAKKLDACLKDNEMKNKSVRLMFALDEENVVYCSFLPTFREQTEIYGSITILFELPKQNLLSKLLLNVFENTHHGMIVTDQNSNIIVCNEYYEQMLGYQAEELIGRDVSIFKSGKLDELIYTEVWREIDANNYWKGNALAKRKDGIVIPLELTIQKISVHENNSYYLGMINILAEYIDILINTHSGGIDLFTQLPGKFNFLKQMNYRAKEIDSETGIFLVIFNPEGANGYSKQFKREVSDALIKMSKRYVCGYLGKNRFILGGSYTKELGNEEMKLARLELFSLIRQLQAELSPECIQILSHSTFGVSVLGVDANNISELFQHALIARRQKHMALHNALIFYDPLECYENKRKNKLAKLAKKSVKNKNIEVFYQPIIDVFNWTVTKVEALCRFRDTHGSLLDSAEMIEYVESLGLITELDLIVAERALLDRELLQQKFNKDIGICINISLNSNVKLKVILKKLLRLFDSYNEKLSNLTIEIPGTSYFDSDNDGFELLRKLKGMGVVIAIDNFGKGYSSFSYLVEPIFDVIKIDSTFISGITESNRKQNIVKTLVRLAREIGVSTVAERVETIEEALILHAIGVDSLQGYCLAKPQALNKLSVPSSLLYKMRKEAKENDEDSTVIITNPKELSPQDDLQMVKEIFEATGHKCLPVINNRCCVGFVDEACYNLNIPASLDTPTEKAQDHQLLKKKVIQIMKTVFYQVEESITLELVMKNIREGKSFPWIVVDSGGKYIGVVEQETVLNMLVSI